MKKELTWIKTWIPDLSSRNNIVRTRTRAFIPVKCCVRSEPAVINDRNICLTWDKKVWLAFDKKTGFILGKGKHRKDALKKAKKALRFLGKKLPWLPFVGTFDEVQWDSVKILCSRWDAYKVERKVKELEMEG